jgi:hypothetical protein
MANERLKHFWEKMDEAVRERNLEMIIFLCSRILSCFDFTFLQEKEPRTINIDE